MLRRGKFRAWLYLEQVTFFIELERLAETRRDPENISAVSNDPDDDYLVALARIAEMIMR